MKEINLTQNKVALVDDEDFKWLNKWKWHAKKEKNTFYARRKKNGKTILMHRVVMFPKDGSEIDHKYYNGLNNQKNNLRICTKQQNIWNTQPYANKSSKFKGVCWHKSTQKWQARISFNYEKTLIGFFKFEIDAAIAYNSKAKQFFGEYAYQNIID